METSVRIIAEDIMFKLWDSEVEDVIYVNIDFSGPISTKRSATWWQFDNVLHPRGEVGGDDFGVRTRIGEVVESV